VIASWSFGLIRDTGAWFSRLLVAAATVEAMVSLDLAYPNVDAAKKKELAATRLALSREP
jgi:hypothetical protein